MSSARNAHASPRLARRLFALGCAGLAAIAAGSGCSSSSADGRAIDDVESAAQPLTTAESSYVSDNVLGALAAWPAMRGRTWDVSHDNRFEGGWILQTPVQPIWGKAITSLEIPKACTTNCDPDFKLARCATQADCTGGGTCTPVLSTVKAPGAAAQRLCVGHSDAIYEEMYSLITSGTKIVDVTSLQPPDGRFEAAIRNALTFLSAKPNPPQVRLLFGAFPVQGVVNTSTVLKSLTRDVPKSSPIDISVGDFRSSDLPASWNHSKIIAVDGREAIVGGHNLWTQHYLDKNPVHDLSMHVRGSAAVAAHHFANVLWKYTCDNMSWLTWTTWSVWINQLDHGTITSHCPKQFDLQVPEGAPSGTVITVGRLGTGIQTDGNQADTARLALMRSARRTLRMSLQDIGPVKAPILGIPLGSWPDAEIGEIAAALARGVDVYVVLSNVGSVAGGLTSTQAPYSNGWTLEDVGGHVRSYMESHAGFPQGSALTELLCTKLHLAPLRYGPDATFADGVPFPNHAKTISVDEQAFYIGSQNVYPAGLQELGFIVDDSRATAEYLARYWTNVWTYSSPRAISGAGAMTCNL